MKKILMKKNNFEKLIPEITRIARKISIFWNNKFEINELVNEAWIKGIHFNSTDIPLILRRAKFDMIDYIRRQTGRIKECDKKGKEYKSKYTVKYKPRYITNIGYVEDSNNNLLDGEHYNVDLLKLENDELIIKLLLEEPIKKQLESI